MSTHLTHRQQLLQAWDHLALVVETFHRLQQDRGEIGDRASAVQGPLKRAAHLVLHLFPEFFVEPEEAFDQLREAHPGWMHPAQILGSSRPLGTQLIDVCDRRLDGAGGAARSELLEIREKLERALRIEESARRRRLSRRLPDRKLDLSGHKD
jgi:hypothetical protein